MIKELQAYHTYQRFIQTSLTICGCWYMPTKSGKSTYYWSVFMFLVHIMYIVISIHMSYISRHNLVNMMKSAGIAISALGTTLKVGTFLINRKSLITYHQILNDVFEEELMQNETIRTIMLSSLRQVCMLAYTYFAILVALVLAYFMPAYLFITRDLLHFHLTTNYTLPMTKGDGHFWTVPHNFLYHLHLLFETFLISISSTTTCSVDTAFGFYVYHFASTMHAMTFRLTNPLSNENFSDLLRMCVAKHQKLLQCRKTLEHIYGKIVFWHIITNAVLLCALLYEATSFSTFNVTNLFAFLTYAIVKLLQTFTYAWYGTLLTSASEDFRTGIYFAKWPSSNLNRHVRTNMILMLMQKPMTINALFSPVDIVMFTNFMNATVSYFFLLQSIGDKGE